MTTPQQFYDAQEKLKAYNEETNNLMLDAMDFDDVYNEKFTLPEMVYLLRNSFRERLTHYEVLGEKEMNPREDWARGFCMYSSYLIYSMTGGDKVWELHGTSLHWWLFHKKSQHRFDITHTQFDTQTLNGHYFLGKNVKYLTTGPIFWDNLKRGSEKLATLAGLKQRCKNQNQ